MREKKFCAICGEDRPVIVQGNKMICFRCGYVLGEVPNILTADKLEVKQ